MIDEPEHAFETVFDELTDEQHQIAADLVLEFLKFEDAHDALSVVTYAMADFLSQAAPSKDSAMGAAVWMMACICFHIEKWDEQRLCDWNETRQ